MKEKWEEFFERSEKILQCFGQVAPRNAEKTGGGCAGYGGCNLRSIFFARRHLVSDRLVMIPPFRPQHLFDGVLKRSQPLIHSGVGVIEIVGIVFIKRVKPAHTVVEKKRSRRPEADQRRRTRESSTAVRHVKRHRHSGYRVIVIDVSHAGKLLVGFG